MRGRVRQNNYIHSFWKRVNVTAGCWEWHGSRNQDGYGQWMMPTAEGRRKNHAAHRLAWMIVRGPIPDKALTIDHLCRVRHCVNPWHMELVENAENVRRGNSPFMQNKRKTHCLRGHEFNTSNTYTDNQGKRHCRRCRAGWDLRRKNGRSHA